MNLTPQIPYLLSSDKAITPKFLKEINGKYIFNLFSPISGNELTHLMNTIPTFIEIIIPIGIICHVKLIHFEESGAYVRDERLDRGVYNLKDGKQWKIQFTIPKQMNRKIISRGDLLGSLIFENHVEFIRFFQAVQFNNIVRYQRLSPLTSKPIQIPNCAGIDLPSAQTYEISPNTSARISTDLVISIPQGFYGRICGRSGLADKYSIAVLGGVIDPGYRGEVFVLLFNHGKRSFKINPGDRIAQLIIEPYAKVVLVECELEMTVRGTRGLGSTGINKIIPFSNEMDNNEKDLSEAYSSSLSLDFSDLISTIESDSGTFGSPNIDSVISSLFE